MVLPTHFAAYSVPGAFPAGGDDFSKSPLRWTVSSAQSGHFHSVLADRNVERHPYLKNTSQICIELVPDLLWANPIPWPSSWPKLLMTKSNKTHFTPLSSNSEQVTRGALEATTENWTVKKSGKIFLYIWTCNNQEHNLFSQFLLSVHWSPEVIVAIFIVFIVIVVTVVIIVIVVIVIVFIVVKLERILLCSNGCFHKCLTRSRSFSP